MAPRAIRRIVIHSAATPNGRPQTVEDIDGWHRERGFSRSPWWRRRCNPRLNAIGYHYVIYVDGSIHTGRARGEIGAHARGHNADSLGVCLIGSDVFAPEQWAALRALLARPENAGLQLCGHRDLSPDSDGDGVISPREWCKVCPGFDVAAYAAAQFVPDPRHVLEEVDA